MPQGGTAVNGRSLIYLSEISRFLCLDMHGPKARSRKGGGRLPPFEQGLYFTTA